MHQDGFSSSPAFLYSPHPSDWCTWRNLRRSPDGRSAYESVAGTGYGVCRQRTSCGGITSRNCGCKAATMSTGKWCLMVLPGGSSVQPVILMSCSPVLVITAENSIGCPGSLAFVQNLSMVIPIVPGAGASETNRAKQKMGNTKAT